MMYDVFFSVFYRCESWTDRNVESNIYGDWFDGAKFEEMKDWITDSAFDLSLCLCVNVDWWQPFQRTVHSMGGVYSSILNLPRDIRQKLENIMTICK